MLSTLNKYCHGYVAVPIIETLVKNNLFDLFAVEMCDCNSLTKKLNANKDYLKISLEALESLGWLEKKEGEIYIVTKDAQPDLFSLELISLYQVSPAALLKKDALFTEKLSSFLALRQKKNSPAIDLIEGALAIPLLINLNNMGLPDSWQKFAELSWDLQRAIESFLQEKQWISASRQWTKTGEEILQKTSVLSIAISYRPILAKMEQLLFGDVAEVFKRSQQESHNNHSLVSAESFVVLAAQVGLFARFPVKHYPTALPFYHITLHDLEKRDYIIRYATKKDLEILYQLEELCWKELQTVKSQIKLRLEKYPQGQFVLEKNNKVVGVIYSQRIENIKQLQGETAETVHRIHNKDGEIVQLLAVNIHPEEQNLGLGDQLLEFMLQRCSVMDGVSKVVGVTLCKNYDRRTSILFDDYIQKRNRHGKIEDPILAFHESHGAEIVHSIKSYRPNDTKNDGYGVLVTYDIRNRIPHKIKQADESKGKSLFTEKEIKKFIEETIKATLRENKDGFMMERPLMEMGLDSSDLLGLQDEIATTYNLFLESGFFFEYNTPKKVVEFLIEKLITVETEETKPINTITTVEQQKVVIVEQNIGAKSNGQNAKDIAIIGISCKLPGGIETPEKFWQLLKNGESAIGTLPPDRFLWPEDIDPQTTHLGINRGGFVDNIANFDANFFRISPREAEIMDPQQRILLELAWTCFENAGIIPQNIIDKNVGVFVGASGSDYAHLLQENNVKIDAHYGTGNSLAVLANRISYFFDFCGPSLQIDTACSSSCVAIHNAMQSLRSDECTQALVAGIHLICHPANSIAYYKAGMLSKDGLCKTFDASANGYVRAEGAVMFLLKPLTKAIEDKDYVHAILKGSAINHGGLAGGLTVPNPQKQSQLLIKAWENAKITPDCLSYIEAHGTGTPLGDPIEIQGIRHAFAKASCTKSVCRIASVKSNIGHLEAAAGIAGVLKAVLCLQKKQLPASIHLQELNPNIELKDSSIRIVSEHEEISIESPLYAGISSFGSGGTNAHIVLQEYPQPQCTEIKKDAYLFTLSANKLITLQAYAQNLLCWIEDHKTTAFFSDFIYTLQVTRIPMDERLAMKVHSFTDLEDKLKEWLKSKKTTEDCWQENSKETYAKMCRLLKQQLQKQIVHDAIQQNDLEQLAILWTSGIDVAWYELYKISPRRIPLPVYPFLKERYWILQTRNTRRLDAQPNIITPPQMSDIKKCGKVKLQTLSNNFFIDAKSGIQKSNDRKVFTLSGYQKAEDNINIETEEVSVETEQISDIGVEKVLKRQLAEVLYIEENKIDFAKPFVELGMDSIIGVEWIKIINEKYHLSISATKLYDHPTTAQLAKFVTEEIKKRPQEKQPKIRVVEANKPQKWNREIPERKRDIVQKSIVQKSAAQESSDRIAVVGMSGRYPEACDLKQYWRNLRQGRNSIRKIPRSRWDVEKYYSSDSSAKGKIYCKWLGMLDDIECFDPLFFSISPKEAELIDPQHRLFLQESYKAFEDSGYSATNLSNQKCGVYLGIMNNEYGLLLSQNKNELANATGNSYAIAAARIAYYLNLKGPAIAVDTACSSSLVAIHLACQALIHHEIDMALAGGVTLYLTAEFYISMCQAGMLSPDGQCKTFDDAANGFVPGEGVGAVVLKRLEDAKKDNDFIYGVILGSGINQDGKTNGITAPSANSQIELEREVYQKYNIHPETISYIETHGTGTKLGDPIELEALATVFSEKTEKKGFCALASVKSNIGHTSAAAGVASLQKVLLSMKHQELVPSLNFNKANSHFHFTDSAFYVNTKRKKWDNLLETPRRAAVSSFGFSGTNAHLVVEEYCCEQTITKQEVTQSVIVPLSAKTKEQLQLSVNNLLAFLEKDIYNDEITTKEYEIKDTIVQMVSQLLKINAELVDINQNFSEYGLDIVLQISLLELLEKQYSIQLNSHEFMDKNSITILSKWLDTLTTKEENNPVMDIVDLSYTLQIGREAMEYRVAFMVNSLGNLKEKLRLFVSDNEDMENCYQGEVKKNKDTISAFVGDEDLRETINTWIQRKKLAKLAEFWVKGLEFDWNKLYRNPKPKRIGLPTYPFIKERYWISQTQNANVSRAKSGDQVIHPLLHNKERTRILDLSREGLDFGRNQHSGNNRQKRISLPTYPFLQKMYWVSHETKTLLPPQQYSTLLPQDLPWNKPFLPEVWSNNKDKPKNVLLSSLNAHADGNMLRLEPSKNNENLGGSSENSDCITSGICLYDCGNGIFLIQIKLGENLLSSVVIQDLKQVLSKIRQHEQVKVVIFACTDTWFLSGGKSEQNIVWEQKLYEEIMAFPFPTIAAMKGNANGAGFLFGVLCDFMICSQESSYSYTNWEDNFFATQQEEALFIKKLGEIHAREFLYTKALYTGESLQKKGWTCPILPRQEVDDYTERLAITLAEMPQKSLCELKQHLSRTSRNDLQEIETEVFCERKGLPKNNSNDDTNLPKFLEWSVHREKIVQINICFEQNLDTLLQGLETAFFQVNNSSKYKSVVISSSHSAFIDVTKQKISDSIVSRIAKLFCSLKVPIVGAFEQNADNLAWLLGLCCDVCIYNENASYHYQVEADSLAKTVQLFSYHFDHSLAKEILFSGKKYKGKELQQRLKVLHVVSSEQVIPTALRLAEHWTQLPPATLSLWKEHLEGVINTEKMVIREEKQPEPIESTTLHSEVIKTTILPTGVVVIKMEDRQAKNMFSPDFVTGINEVFTHIQKNPICKVVILIGYDNYFASGGTKEALESIQQGTMKYSDVPIYELPIRCPLPVISVMQGHAIGAGWTLGMFADLVFFAEESVYTSKFMSLGFTPGAGSTLLFRYQLGEYLGKEILFTAHKYKGYELKERGLSVPILPRNEVQEHAINLAEKIAQNSRETLVALKELFVRDLLQKLPEIYTLEVAMHAKTFVYDEQTLAKIQQNFSEYVPNTTSQKETLQNYNQNGSTFSLKKLLANELHKEATHLVKTTLSVGTKISPAEMVSNKKESISLEQLEDILTANLAKKLCIREGDIDKDEDFIAMGMDSILSIEFLTVLQNILKLELSTSTLYNHPTISKLANYIYPKLSQTSETNSLGNDFAPKKNNLLPLSVLPQKDNAKANDSNYSQSSKWQRTQQETKEKIVLPTLPLPSLEETCQNYLEWILPLVTEEEWKKTKALVLEFVEGVGSQLQQQLKTMSQSSHTSYVAAFWREMYLENRHPLAIYQNPGIVNYLLEGDRITLRIAHLIVAVLAFYKNLAYMEPDFHNGQPLSMEQYQTLLYTRIPGIKYDSVKFTLDSNHIVVVYNNVFYRLEVIQNDEIISPVQLEKNLAWIMQQKIEDSPALGILTTQYRTQWAISRQALLAVDPINYPSLETIESSLFILCLDQEQPENKEQLSQNMLHGNGRNRWFDKSLQIIVTANGYWGTNMEHTLVDGYTMLRLFVETMTISPNAKTISTNLSFAPPSRLNWQLSEDLRHTIKQAEQDMDKLIANMFTKVMEFSLTNMLEKQYLDAIVQISLQNTYWQMYGEIPSVYEPVHMRHYEGGRTEGLRTATKESHHFIKLLHQKTSVGILKENLLQAIEAHSQRQKMCSEGKGIDRHLFCLHTLAHWQNEKCAIFDDKTFLKFSQTVVSTSHVSAIDTVELGGFGPVVTDGYGVAYIIKKDRITFNVTHNHVKEIEEFMHLLEQSLTKIISLIEPVDIGMNGFLL